MAQPLTKQELSAGNAHPKKHKPTDGDRMTNDENERERGREKTTTTMNDW